jgi:transketolase
MTADAHFDVAAARERCRRHRLRILELSQGVTALHAAPAFSCLEIVDTIYHGLMRDPDQPGRSPDRFVLSKGHGCMAQYVVLESLGVLSSEELDAYCTVGGRLGGHPDYGLPGIEASTGSLGHGLSMALGMAYATKHLGPPGTVYAVLSDGEVQEGSVWEAAMMAPTLGADNLVAFIDNNDFQSLGRTSVTHPSFYPVVEKFEAFGWESVQVEDGHDPGALATAVRERSGGAPLMVVCRTTKGKGVSFMENEPIWHYRSPSPEEYAVAIREIEAS